MNQTDKMIKLLRQEKNDMMNNIKNIEDKIILLEQSDDTPDEVSDDETKNSEIDFIGLFRGVKMGVVDSLTPDAFIKSIKLDGQKIKLYYKGGFSISFEWVKNPDDIIYHIDKISLRCKKSKVRNISLPLVNKGGESRIYYKEYHTMIFRDYYLCHGKKTNKVCAWSAGHGAGIDAYDVYQIDMDGYLVYVRPHADKVNFQIVVRNPAGNIVMKWRTEKSHPTFFIDHEMSLNTKYLKLMMHA